MAFHTHDAFHSWVDDYKNCTNNFKPSDHLYTPVLKLSDIYLRADAVNNIYIGAKGYPLVKVPDVIVFCVQQTCREQNVISYDKMGQMIIDECINKAVFFHPCDELKYLINISN